MSYDDGQVYDRRLVEIFNRYGIRGTFHLNSGKLDSEPFLKSSEIKELFTGHEISAHTVNHPYLTLIPNQAVAGEILDDRRNLETLVGYPVRGLSYPFGAINEEVLRTLPGFGIEYSRTVNSHGDFRLPDNFLLWHPTCHHDSGLAQKAKEFKNMPPWSQMPLLYVWGHSFEFERNNNWGDMEEFCKVVSGDEDVWYATNIEIKDYVTAMRELKFSVDGRIVQNPSALPVWIRVGGEAVEIGPGQRVSL
jgi:peptidoglycan/xylan/chitin deacetylase (PgdA/CDA1 family)